MKITRSARRTHFTQIPNDTARDRRLSFRARGLLLYLLSHDDGWSTSADRLRHEAAEGRDSIATALGELESHRYIKRTKTKDSRGHFVHELFVYDVPLPPGGDDEPGRGSNGPTGDSSKGVGPGDAAVSESSLKSASEPDSVSRASTSPQRARPVDNVRGRGGTKRPHRGSTAEFPQVSPQTGFQGVGFQQAEIQSPVDQGPVVQNRVPRAHLEDHPEKTQQEPPPPTPSATATGTVLDAAPVEVEDQGEIWPAGWDDFAGALPVVASPRSGEQWRQLAALVTPYLAGGWLGRDLAEAACTAPLPPMIGNPPGFIRQRLLGLPQTPWRATHDSSGQNYGSTQVEPLPTVRPWCGHCHESTRMVEWDNDTVGRCPRCHPQAPGPAPWDVEGVAH